MITYERVHELFYYNGSDLVWKICINPRAPKGNIAGCLRHDKYRIIRVDGKSHLAHRLVWLFIHGYLPENFIDHINRNPSDNRLENLRVVTQSCNMKNCGNYVTNISGVKGVFYDKSRKKWSPNIKINNKKYHLGRFKDFDEAVLLRLAAEQCVGWDKCDKLSPAHKYAIDNKLIRLPG